MLFNNANIVCCEQMVAGSSTTGNSSSLVASASSSQNQSHTLHHRSHHGQQLQNISIATQQSTKDQFEDKEHVQQQQQQQQQQQTKGLKRRNESDGTATPVVLGSSSTDNISHETDLEMTSGGVVNVTVKSTVSGCSGLTIDKCNGTGAMYLNTKHSLEDNNGRGGNNNDDEDSTCDGEEYDYSSILARILNEKKLALSKSPEVVQFLQNPSNGNPSNGEDQDRIVLD